MRNFFIVIFSFLFILLAVVFIFIQPSSKNNYQNGNYLLKNELVLEQLDFQDSFSQGNIEAGWVKLSLVPPFSTPIAIDDHRGGKHFEGVRDTVYTRSIVLRNDNQKVAIVSADLLIIPPLVTQILDTILILEGFSLENIYLSATHSHSSIGGWQNSFVGEIFAGEYDKRVPLFIAQKIAESILRAEKELQQADIHFLSIPTENLVFNRLVGEKGKVDDKIRLISFERKDGTKAIWFTFAAHCTYFHEKMMKLSADWAGEAVLKIEEKIPQSFAMYSAGAVGSHGPIEFSKNQSENIQQMGKAIAEIISKNHEKASKLNTSNLNLNTLPFSTPHPTFLLNPDWQIRPFWFEKIFGEVNSYIQILLVGEVLFLSMPADFSGELMEELELVAKENKLHFGLTSFNGTYVGYITADDWASMNSYETTTMNWLGHGSGGFFKSLNKAIILKASKSKPISR